MQPVTLRDIRRPGWRLVAVMRASPSLSGFCSATVDCCLMPKFCFELTVDRVTDYMRSRTWLVLSLHYHLQARTPFRSPSTSAPSSTTLCNTISSTWSSPPPRHQHNTRTRPSSISALKFSILSDPSRKSLPSLSPQSSLVSSQHLGSSFLVWYVFTPDRTVPKCRGMGCVWMDASN